MRYMGSKRLLFKHFKDIILKDRKPDQYYVEPFVGGFNSIVQVEGPRIASDVHPYLIACFKALQMNWVPPATVTEDCYKHIRSNKEDYPPELVGFVGFACSFGGEFFNSYARAVYDKTGTPVSDCFRQQKSCIKKSYKLKGVDIKCCDYKELKIPTNSIIYCDPPYEKARKYRNIGKFNHKEFWQWCRDKTKEGHKVFISEYEAPEDFTCVWKKENVINTSSTHPSKQSIEKLFTYEVIK